VNDNTARMRVDRALDKLRTQLERRGVTSTTAALAAVLANQAVVAAPAGLVAAVTGVALAGSGAAAGAGAGGGLIATFMSMTKLQVGITSALAIAGTTGLVLQAQSNDTLRSEVATLRQENAQIATLQAENLKLARTSAEVADMRGDDAELAKLGDESVALKARMQKVALAKAAAAATTTATRANFAGEVYDISKLDQVPRAKFQARPQYPFEMRRAGIEGSVIVDFIIDTAGNVQNAFAAKSSQREFEAAAIQAVSQWQFDPGRKGSGDVNTHMQVPIVFTLREKSGTPGTPKPVSSNASSEPGAFTIQSDRK
jgi:TonB family protein